MTMKTFSNYFYDDINIKITKKEITDFDKF